MKVKNKSPWTKAPAFTGGHPNCKTPVFINDAQPEGEKHHEKIHFDIETNAIKDMGEGKIMFTKPVTITDTTEMWSGYKYDIKSMDIDNFSHKLTADHRSGIQYVLGKVLGLKKVGNKKVTIDGLQLAVTENPLADFAKRMIMAGYLTDFSIESIGPWPDDDGIFQNSKLVNLSLVVIGNNKSAHINQLALQSMDAAKEHGLDIAAFKEALNYPIDKDVSVSDNTLMKFKKISNSKSFAVELKYKNSAGEETTVVLNAGQSIDIPDTDDNKLVEDQVTNAVEPKKTETKTENTLPANTDLAGIVTASVKAAIESQVKPLTDKIALLEKNQFDNGVQEPGFFTNKTTGKSGKIADLGSTERSRLQMQSALDFLVRKDAAAGRTLNDINSFNMEELQKSGKVDNSMTIADFGNFVISPELLTEIEGFRSDFQPFLAKTQWKQTLSTSMAWLTRQGDIDMRNVKFCDDGNDGNLKPLSEYGASIKTADLEEMAAVTPVCNAATRFLAVDLLGDAAEGYRTDYDRKRSQLVIIKLQQAVNESGQTGSINAAAANALNPLFSLVKSAASVAEKVQNGLWIMNYSSYYQLLMWRMSAGFQTDKGFDLFTTGDNPNLVGMPYIVVPNELLPTVNTAETRTFYEDGEPVTIDQSLFLADLNKFSGRTSGGLNYDLSTEAAYEDGDQVKSAFQRNELVLRGSFFRGGAFRDPSRAAGLANRAVS